MRAKYEQNPAVPPQRTEPSARDEAQKTTTGVTRREFLAATTLGGGLAVGCAQRVTARPVSMTTFGERNHAGSATDLDRELMEVSISQLQRYYTQRKYTVSEVVDWYLGRIRRFNGIYRPIENLFEDDARAEAARADANGGGSARGPLWGIPIVIKANTSIAGKVTTDGWKGFVMPGHELMAPRDAAVVARLRTAGAIILGHTNMPDFADSDTTRSTSFGRTGNAYDVRFSPGGSSGGTVTSVTGNLAMLGTRTDTGNSIRMPAATSALVGIFPTRGLVSIAGIVPLDWLLDNTGPIARTVTDAAIALGVMSGEDPRDTATKGSAAKAQPGPYTQYLKPDALRGKRFGVPAFILQGIGIPFHGIPAAASELTAARQIADAAVALDPRTRAAFLRAIEALRAHGATVVMEDSLLGERFVQVAARVSTYAYVRNMLGVPAVSLVGGFYESGLPFGLEFSGRPFRDGDLLGYAYAWERATRYRRPPELVERGLLSNA